jgi:hypothetical protein
LLLSPIEEGHFARAGDSPGSSLDSEGHNPKRVVGRRPTGFSDVSEEVQSMPDRRNEVLGWLPYDWRQAREFLIQDLATARGHPAWAASRGNAEVVPRAIFFRTFVFRLGGAGVQKQSVALGYTGRGKLFVHTSREIIHRGDGNVGVRGCFDKEVVRAVLHQGMLECAAELLGGENKGSVMVQVDVTVFAVGDSQESGTGHPDDADKDTDEAAVYTAARL